MTEKHDKPKIPTWAYRFNTKTNEPEARIFSDTADIPKGKGWHDHPDKAKAPEKTA